MYMQGENFRGAPAPGAPVVPTPLMQYTHLLEIVIFQLTFSFIHFHLQYSSV